jgi:hypothetical protein
MEAFHLQRTRFELVGAAGIMAPAGRKVRRWQLTDDGNVEITGRELREKSPTSGVPHTLLARLSAWDSPEKP